MSMSTSLTTNVPKWVRVTNVSQLLCCACNIQDRNINLTDIMFQAQVRHQRVNVLVVAEHRTLTGRHNVHQTGGRVQIVRRHARTIFVAHPLRLLVVAAAAASARRASVGAVGTDTNNAAAAAAQIRAAASRRIAVRTGRRGVGRCGGHASRHRLTFAEQKRRRFAEAEAGPTGVRGAHLALWRTLHGLVSLDLTALLQRVEVLWMCVNEDPFHESTKSQTSILPACH